MFLCLLFFIFSLNELERAVYLGHYYISQRNQIQSLPSGLVSSRSVQYYRAASRTDWEQRSPTGLLKGQPPTLSWGNIPLFSHLMNWKHVERGLHPLGVEHGQRMGRAWLG